MRTGFLVSGLCSILSLAACGSSHSENGAQGMEKSAGTAVGEIAQFKIGPPLNQAEERPHLLDDYRCGGGMSKKVKICHIPPGNPDQRHTVCVGLNAFTSHLREHIRGTLGDYLGPCAPSLGNGGDPGGHHDGRGGCGQGEEPDDSGSTDETNTDTNSDTGSDDTNTDTEDAGSGADECTDGVTDAGAPCDGTNWL